MYAYAQVTNLDDDDELLLDELLLLDDDDELDEDELFPIKINSLILAVSSMQEA